MENSIIIDLAFDGDSYRDNIKLLEDEEYKKNDKIFWEICEKLLMNLPQEERKKIDYDLFLALGGIESAIEEIFFKEGFKLGLKIGAQNFLD